jgi:hypothetical protein
MICDQLASQWLKDEFEAPIQRLVSAIWEMVLRSVEHLVCFVDVPANIGSNFHNGLVHFCFYLVADLF